MAGWHHVVAALLLEVALWGSIVLAIALRSWFGLLLLPTGVAIVFALQSIGTTLLSTDTQAVSRARVWLAVEIAILAAAVAIAYLLFGHGANAS